MCYLNCKNNLKFETNVLLLFVNMVSFLCHLYNYNTDNVTNSFFSVWINYYPNLLVMNTLRILACLLVVSSSGYSQITEDWVMEALQKYSPNSFYIINQYKINGSTVSHGSFTITSGMEHLEHCEMSDKKSFLATISTCLHETTHAFDTQTAYFLANEGFFEMQSFGYRNEGFFFDPTKRLAFSFEEHKFFPSSELDKVIPKNLKTFRYDTYVLSDSYSNSTQCNGIIGLLEEFNAYYHGTKLQFDLLPLYKEVYGNEFLNHWSFATSAHGDAFYEFDFWIKEYLLHTKIKEPKLYLELKNDSNFKNIYRTIRSNYSNLIQQYERKFDEFNTSAQKSNTAILVANKHQDNVYPILCEQIKSEKYDEIKRLFLGE